MNNIIILPEEKHEKIFEDFSQADSFSDRKYGGTGLGLSISRRLARLLGGDLHVKSKVGKGARFTLRLPLPKSVEKKPHTATFADIEIDTGIKEKLFLLLEVKKKEIHTMFISTK